jgi:hypothetical protein
MKFAQEPNQGCRAAKLLVDAETFHFEECETRTGAQRSCPVEREYDLFEICANGSLVWREVVSGHGKAILKLRELSARQQMRFA